MHLEFSERGENEFEAVGEWFWTFVELGERLGAISLDDDSSIARLVLAVPDRDLVATAITLGVSAHRFSIQDDVLEHAEEIGQISPGVKLRLEWPTRVVVGRFVRSELLVRGSDTFLKVVLTVNGVVDSRTIKLVSAIRLAPEGMPEGVYESSSAANSLQLEWERQALPGAIVFGDGSFWKSQMDIAIRSEHLEGLITNNPATAFEACRMDQLTPIDKYPHFINVFEKLTQFPELGTSADEVMKNYGICLLDGNAAIDALFDKRRLEQMLIIGLLETGVQHLQDQAVERVKGSTSHLTPMADPYDVIGWKPPGRSVLMGWSREV